MLVKRGRFFTFEGGEGAGKTTVIERLAEDWTQAGYRVISTREPGGVAIAEQIRGVILHMDNTGMDGRTEALLYAAARRQHLMEKVLPALNDGCIVLCDRFIDSSLAYQGIARGLGIEEVYSINQFAIEGLMPDATLYLDLSPEIGLNRIRSNEHREQNRLDVEAMSFHRRVRDGYLEIAQRFPDRIVKIDASARPEEVYRQVRAVLDKKLPISE